MSFDPWMFSHLTNRPRRAAKSSTQRMRELRKRNPDYDRQARARRAAFSEALRAEQAAAQPILVTLPALVPVDPALIITLPPARELEPIPLANPNPAPAAMRRDL